MRNYITTFCLLICGAITAQNLNGDLQSRIENLIRDFHGQVGIYVKDLQGNRCAAVNADSIFPTASIVKIPIMIGIMKRIQLHQLEFHQNFVYQDTMRYDPGEDMLASFKPGEKIQLSKLLLLSISLSDNTASLMLQGIAGGGHWINQLMDSLGYNYTKVNSRTTGREIERERYGWGQTTPREIVRIMEQIVKGKMLDPASSDRMLRTLGRQYWDEEAISQIPPDIFVASKSGALDQCRNEILYVNARHPFIFSIFTKNNSDSSWEYSNEAWVLTRKLSSLLFKYFNPGIRYEAAEVSKK